MRSRILNTRKCRWFHVFRFSTGAGKTFLNDRPNQTRGPKCVGSPRRCAQGRRSRRMRFPAAEAQPPTLRNAWGFCMHAARNSERIRRSLPAALPAEAVPPPDGAAP